MREILFKAKRRDNGEWVEGSLIFLDVDIGYYLIKTSYPGESTHPVRPLIDEHTFFVKPETICQYTGLTDKNGNKIWENDVVQYTDEIVNKVKTDLVEWNETHASFTRLHKSKMGLQYLYINEGISNKCEVVGNIFDNPELLEVHK